MSTVCKKCKKPGAICICDRLSRLSVDTKIVILQHPAEQDIELGTAPILEQMLGAICLIGLTWPASAIKKTLNKQINPSEWGVLYPLSLKKPLNEIKQYQVISPSGSPIEKTLKGIIVLDGTWSQAKSLWWKNPWLLKFNRVIVSPKEPSIYGRMRKEPRREWVSTLESVAEALTGNGEDPSVALELRKSMRTMVQRARDVRKVKAK